MATGTAEPRLLPSDTAANYAWLHKFARLSPVGIYRCDAQGGCSYVNERWTELTGIAAEAALATGWTAAIHPEDGPWLGERWRALTERGVPFKCEYRYRRPDGAVRWVYGEVAEDRDAAGRLAGYIGTVTDVSELHGVREELQQAHAELEARVRERTLELRAVAMVVEQSDDAIIRSDLTGRIVGWNQGAERIFGYTAAEMLGGSTLQLAPPEEHAVARAVRERVRAGETVSHFEAACVCKSGAIVELSLSLVPLRDEAGVVVGMSGVGRDITERKKVERRLQQLTRRLQHAHEEERRRIARELHDSTAQVLVALTMNLAALARPTDATTHARLIEDSAALAQQVLREIRTQSYVLHPPLLEERGLIAALRCFAEGFTTRSGIAVALDVPADFPRLPEVCEAALFRVVQESLANVHRHAQSPNARIALRSVGRRIELTVRDFGRGFSADAAQTAGVGVAGMKERLHQLGGDLHLEPAAPGACIVATLPLD